MLVDGDGNLAKNFIIPRNDWCVLRVIPPGMTPGGLHKPENAYEELPKCEVVAVGPGRMMENGSRLAPELAVGDVVHVFGNAIAVDSASKIMMIREDAIICVVGQESN